MNIKHSVGYFKAEANVHQENCPHCFGGKNKKCQVFYIFFLKIVKVWWLYATLFYILFFLSYDTIQNMEGSHHTILCDATVV
jgi:hypothetical protein